MIKIVIFILLLILASVSLFAIENMDSIFIKIPFYQIYEISKVAFLTLSATIGALFVLIIFFIRDSKRAIDNLKLSKKQKKEERIRQYLMKAFDATVSKKTETARDNFNEILKLDPENIDVLIKLGDLASEDGNYTAALDYYRKAYDLNRHNVFSLLSLAEIYERMGQDDDTLRYLDEILSFDKENLAALYRKRSIFEKKYNWEILLTIQETIIRLQKNTYKNEIEKQILIGYEYERAMEIFNTGDYEKAMKAFKAILKSNSQFLPAYIGLADSLSKLGEIQAASNVLENAYAEIDNLILLIKNEDLLINTPESGKIIKAYKNAFLKNPDDYRIKFLLGRAYERLNKFSVALEYLEPLDSIISNPYFYLLKARLHLEQNRHSDALEDLKKVTISDNFNLIYTCFKCGNNTIQWSSRCSRCNNWNTLQVNINGIKGS